VGVGSRNGGFGLGFGIKSESGSGVGGAELKFEIRSKYRSPNCCLGLRFVSGNLLERFLECFGGSPSECFVGDPSGFRVGFFVFDFCLGREFG
jgi:hypothetical protein